MPICLALERQEICRAFSRACAKTGNRMAARIAMIAMTTRSSIRVKARLCICSFLLWRGVPRPVVVGPESQETPGADGDETGLALHLLQKYCEPVTVSWRLRSP